MQLMRRLTAVAFFILLALIAAGCGGDQNAPQGRNKSEDNRDRLASDWGGPDGGGKKKEEKKGEDKKGDTEDAPGDRSEAREMKREEAHVGGVTPVPGAG